MNNLIRSEFSKLNKDRSFRFIVIMLLVISVVAPLFFGDVSSFEGNEFYRTFILLGNYQIVIYLPLILAGFFIANEYQTGTMKIFAASGNSRMNIYLSKLIVYGFGSIVIMTILPVVMIFSSCIIHGFSMLPDIEFFLKTLALNGLYTAAFSAFAMIAATLLNESGKVIGVLLLFFALADQILGVIGGVIPWLNPFIQNSIFVKYDELPFIDQLNQFGSGEIVSFIVYPLGSIIVLSVIGVMIFSRKEIK